MITPQEAAKFAIGGSGGLDPEKVCEFLLAANPKQIQEFLHCTGVNGYPRLIEFARVALDIKLAEDAERTAQKLVKLTHGLYVFTIVLIVFGAVDVIKFLLGLICHHGE
jgi:hypothetical protein